jgi:hypothetical protein
MLCVLNFCFLKHFAFRLLYSLFKQTANIFCFPRALRSISFRHVPILFLLSSSLSCFLFHVLVVLCLLFHYSLCLLSHYSLRLYGTYFLIWQFLGGFLS